MTVISTRKLKLENIFLPFDEWVKIRIENKHLKLSEEEIESEIFADDGSSHEICNYFTQKMDEMKRNLK